MASEKGYWDYFAGAVPAGAMFKAEIDELGQLVLSSKESKHLLNRTAEMCLIGLVSHFEAFCKNQFASCVNICPQLLKDFCRKRPDATILISDLLTLDFDVKPRIGFLIAEKYDFGSAKSINSLYADLLSFTPFSSEQVKKYAQLLEERNLLVHHGGIYTIKFGRQRFLKQSIKNRIFFDSLIVHKKDFMTWMQFIDKVASKIVASSHKYLTESIRNNGFKLSKYDKEALDALDWYL